jgi:excinuclease UvrABC nuclease subunit
MINTKNINNKDMGLTPAQRKEKVLKLKEEHQDYFDISNHKNVLYIPKMAYRPSGKDELHVSFFPSELEKEEDVYTEFVSIDYDSEDPKRTLYLHKYNPHWKEEYELITSNSGFQRHLIPVTELKVINDVTSRGWDKQTALEEGMKGTDKNETMTLFDLPNPDATPESSLVDKLEEINQTLITLTKVINKFNK